MGIRHNFDAPKSCQDLAKKLGLLQGIWRWPLDGTHCWVTKISKKMVLKCPDNGNENILKNSTSPSKFSKTAPAHNLCLLHCYVSYGYDHSEAQKLQF